MLVALFVLIGGVVAGNAQAEAEPIATPAAQCATDPPAVVPEVPMAPLLPLTGIATVAGVVVILRRRAVSVAPSSDVPR